MNKDTNEVVMTVKEWEEKAGLKLFNYDGFTRIYSKLAGNDSDGFYMKTVNRFRDAGDLLCTRKAFESGLMECTMELPQMSQYEKMAEVIPEFVEKNINLHISAIIGRLTHFDYEENELRKEIEDLLSFMKQKVNAREKSIVTNGRLEEVEISELDEKMFDESEIAIIKEHDGTVEGLEAKLSNEVIQSLEEMLQGRNLQLSEIPLDKIKVLMLILYSTARQKTNPKIEEEFIYINVPDQKKEPFIKTYNIFGGEGMKTGVVFDLETENGRVRGAMPTTPEMNEKIKRATGPKVIDAVPAIEEADVDKSLQMIDNEVRVEDRISLKTRIKEFVKKIVDKIKGKNEGR